MLPGKKGGGHGSTSGFSLRGKRSLGDWSPLGSIRSGSSKNDTEPSGNGINRNASRSASPTGRTTPRDLNLIDELGGKVDMASRGTPASYHTTRFPHELPALQGGHLLSTQGYEPLNVADCALDSFDLVSTSDHDNASVSQSYLLEQKSDLILSKFHLCVILQDYAVLQKFIKFLTSCRPSSLPLLRYYLALVKAQAALDLSNCVVDTLQPISYHGSKLEFTATAFEHSLNKKLDDDIETAIEIMARHDLPAFVIHIWLGIVEASAKQKVIGTMPQHLQDVSEGLAETFCLTDASKYDNPIIFASEEFYKTTQYGTSYAVGRNCRFLQGPKTSFFAVQRLKDKILAGEEHHELLMNYRRDGSQFMNLLMCAPLKDLDGKVRYFLGAQVDVSGLTSDLSGLEYLKKAAYGVDGSAQADGAARGADTAGNDPATSLQRLAESLNDDELDVIGKHGGRMHHPFSPRASATVLAPDERPRLVIASHHHHQPLLMRSSSSSGGGGTAATLDLPGHRGPGLDRRGAPSVASSGTSSGVSLAGIANGGHLGAMYEYYLLVRPAPSLRILFSSPSLRIPGLLQSCLLHRIGGPPRTRELVIQALNAGRAVTANIVWLTRPSNGHYGVDNGAGRSRWLHATPMVSASGAVGVWMIVLVDDDTERNKSQVSSTTSDLDDIIPWGI